MWAEPDGEDTVLPRSFSGGQTGQNQIKAHAASVHFPAQVKGVDEAEVWKRYNLPLCKVLPLCDATSWASPLNV